MWIGHQAIRVFVFQQLIDMRCGFERLCFLVRSEFKQDITRGHVYLFMGKNKRRAKVLTYDGTGLLLIHKRLEIGQMNRLSDLKQELTGIELARVLMGNEPIKSSVFIDKKTHQ